MADETKSATISDLEQGLRFGHVLMSINRHVGQEGACYAQALVALLLEKGVITAEEFEAQLATQREEMAGNPQVNLAKGPDKYDCDQAVIDCFSRLELCRAVCCTFRFYVTVQDLDEGIVKWDYGNPYWVRLQENGYCIHCDPDSLACQIHEQRPYTCRLYDCRQDKRVWVDFEKRIPNPDLGKNA